MNDRSYSSTSVQYRNRRTGDRVFAQKLPAGTANAGMILTSPVVRTPNQHARTYTVDEFEARYVPVPA